MNGKYFIDSNIFLYTFTDDDVEKHEIAKAIVLNGKQNISVQVISEVSNNLIKKLKFEEEDVAAFVKSCYERYVVVGLSKKIFIKASWLRKNYYFSYFDSIIVSCALLSQSEVLYSEDMQHLQMVEQKMKIINPFKVET